MDIDDYRKQFIDELRFNAEHEGTEPETQFIEKSLSDLEEIGELNDPIPMSVEMRGARNRILAFEGPETNFWLLMPMHMMKLMVP